MVGRIFMYKTKRAPGSKAERPKNALLHFAATQITFPQGTLLKSTFLP